MKKRLYVKLVAGLLALGVWDISLVNANTIDKNVSGIDPEGVINIAGNLDVQEDNIPVNLIILEKSTGETLLIKQELTDENGKYMFSVQAENFITDGGDFTYKVIGQIENGEYGEFSYYTKDERDEVARQIEEIKKMISGLEIGYETGISRIATILKNSGKILSFTKADLLNFIEVSSEKIAKMLYDENLTGDNIVRYISEAETISSIEKASSEDEIEKLMSRKELRLNLVAEYAEQTGEEKAQLNARLADDEKTYVKFSDFYSDVREKIIVIGFYNHRGTAAISDRLKKYDNLFNLDTYNKMSNDKTAMLKKIDKAIEENRIHSFDDIQKILDIYIEKKKPSGSSGSGGAGSSGSGGVGGSGSGTALVAGAGENDYNTLGVVETRETQYSDLENYEWAKNSIIKLSKLGIISGYSDGSYRPQNEVTRAELSKIIYLTIGLGRVDDESVFDDVESGAWYADYVNALYQAGIINGTGERVFSPDEKVTRQDICTILYRALRYKGFMKTDSEYQNSFSDREKIDEYAREAVDRLTEAQIITGFDDGSFRALKTCSRAEAAKLTNMVYDYMN